MKRVVRISVSPVEGFRLSHPEQVLLGRDGVADNRRFFLVCADGQRLRSSLTAWPVLVRADYDADAELLRMRFPDGSDVEGDAHANGATVQSTAGTLHLTGRVVEGAWEAPLSRLAGHPVRLVRADRPGAGMNAPVTLVSDGSLGRLAEVAGRAHVDSRRFRMLFEVAECEPHDDSGRWSRRPLRRDHARSGDRRARSRHAETAQGVPRAARERWRRPLRRVRDGRAPGMVRVGDPLSPAA
jgi:uncharacterized protein YcbX